MHILSRLLPPLMASFASAVLAATPSARPEPVTASEFPEAEAAARKLSVASGLTLEVFAAEPLIANPVSFSFDEQGRAYVVETHRRRTSVFDIRNFPDWLDADFSFQTVADREAFYRTNVVPQNKSFIDKAVRGGGRSSFGDFNNDGVVDWRDLEVESERVRVLADTTGNGRADTARVFSDGYNSIVSGVAAGVLARDGKVWFTCIPDLWLLEDRTGDGHADTREQLLHGFGVHIAFGGHDLHGLAFGPDGKLYFSIADRGANVVNREGLTVAAPHTGSVFRCNPDGTEFEIFATGLRNPQELAFDQFGNLWTADNNGDGGDKARLVYVVEGGDSGWTLGWQWLPRMGAWNSERLWHLAPGNTAAYLLPPVAHIGHGPAGFAFYPGTGMPARYDNHFFMADFPGGVRTFSVRPSGAGFVVNEPAGTLADNSPARMENKLVWGLYPVDVEFGPEGGAYVADWIEGWEKTGKGRIFRIYDPAVVREPIVAEVKRLLSTGMRQRPVPELVNLLNHRDQRIRREAQFALAQKGRDAISPLQRAATRSTNQLGRLHAIWALGQIHAGTPRNESSASLALDPILPLLQDPDAEVRAQVAKVFGEGRVRRAADDLPRLLSDPNARVRFFAAMSLGQLQEKRASLPLIETLRANADADPYLRHACVLALARIGELDDLFDAMDDPSPDVRMGSLLALRRLQRTEIAFFLRDAEPSIVLEAARAIYDEPIEGAIPQLASLGSTFRSSNADATDLEEAIWRRIIQANFRLGRTEHAILLTAIAASGTTPETRRVEALRALGDWVAPPVRDRVTGLWRPANPREVRSATIPLRSELGAILTSDSDAVRIAAMETIARLDLFSAGPVLFELFTDPKSSSAVRLASLKALSQLKDRRFREAVRVALDSDDEALQTEASRLSPVGGTIRLSEIRRTLERGSPREKQNALRQLSTVKTPEADELVAHLLEQWLAGTLPAEVHLELLEAAAQRSSAAVQEGLRKLRESRSPEDPLSGYRESLAGGDAAAGKIVFYEQQEAACLRCHKAGGDGGEVGPDLTGIGSRHGREYLLESILLPNRVITAGYETALITLNNGATYAGVVESETETELKLNSAEDGIMTLAKAAVASREKGPSSMMEGLGELLTRRELRDLVEFLATLK